MIVIPNLRLILVINITHVEEGGRDMPAPIPKQKKML